MSPVSAFRRALDRALSWWFDTAMRHALWVILATTVAAAGTLYYTINHLRINTYTADMLSEKLAWRQDNINYEKAFPQFKDSVVIVIDGATPDQARDGADALYAKLAEQARLFEWVFYPQAEPFFRRNALLFSSSEDLDRLSENLAKVQPFLAELSADPSLRGMFSLLRLAVEESDSAGIDLSSAFRRIAAALKSTREGGGALLSWEELMSDKDAKPDARRVLMVAMPKIDYGSLEPGAEAMMAIRQAAADLKLSDQAVDVRLTGWVALAHDELESASLGAQLASLGSFLGVAAVMAIGLRSVSLVFAIQVGLVLGLIFTAGFATFAIGELNLISVAFSVMYIGLGADYAIYLCLRYRELAMGHADYRAALKKAVWHVGGSLEIGTITTAIGFFCFIPTSYDGVAELGIISGAGMFISLTVTLAILPAMLSFRRPAGFKGDAHSEHKLPRWAQRVMTFPLKHARWVVAGAALLGIGAAALLTQAKFDPNPLNLQDPKAESVIAFRELLGNSEDSPWVLGVLVPDRVAAISLKEQLERLKSVSKAQILDDFVPDHQVDKLDTIDGLILTLGPSLENPDLKPPPTLEENLQSVRRFMAQLAEYVLHNPESPAVPSALLLQSELANALYQVEQAVGDDQQKLVKHLERTLVGNLQGRLRELIDSLQAREVGVADLPDDFRNRWITATGTYRIEIAPKEDLHDPEALRRFVTEVRSVAPHATGMPVLFLESSDAVVQAFLQAFAYALIAVTVVLFVTMRNKSDVALVLIPLVLSSLLTGALVILIGVPFNFANIIALPLVFGMGVDNCIHMVHRFRTAPPKDGILLHTSTALAVALSALTNVSGFGNLAVAPHLGMASMGVMLTVGILITLFCTMIVLPSLLALFLHWQRRHHHQSPSAQADH